MSYFKNFNGGSDEEEEKEKKDDGEEDDEEEDDEEKEDDDEEEEDEEDEEEDDEKEDDEEEDDDAGKKVGGDPESDIGEENEDGEENIEKKPTKIKKIPAKNVYKQPVDFVDDEDDDDDGEQYLQKFDRSVNENYILNFHPESVLQNYDEILIMTKVTRNADGIIIDQLHRTIPYLTKYEKARILGQRAKQINSGAYPFVKVPETVIDGYIIAEMELKEKRIPFIIRRPLPNGGSEYWKIQDLEDISF